MIGQNDKQGQNFTVGDAQSLVSFAARTTSAGSRCGRSTGTAQCGSTYSETGLLSNTCSGTDAVRPAVHPDLRPAAGHRGDPAVLWQRAARRRRTPTRRTRRTRCGRRAPATRSATRSSRTARSTRPSGTTAATTRRRRCSSPGRRPGSCSARWCPASAQSAIPTLPRAPTRPGRSRHPVPGRRQGALPGPAVPGQVGQPGRLPRHPVDRPVRLGVEGAVQHPRRAERLARPGRRPPAARRPRRASPAPSTTASP